MFERRVFLDPVISLAGIGGSSHRVSDKAFGARASLLMAGAIELLLFDGRTPVELPSRNADTEVVFFAVPSQKMLPEDKIRRKPDGEFSVFRGDEIVGSTRLIYANPAQASEIRDRIKRLTDKQQSGR